MRVIRGILKTKRLTVPKGFPSRPTTDFAKEGLFNILENRFALYDLNMLDLCSGTGNISFELLSREAGHVTAVDQNFNCVRHIQKCAKDFEVDENIDVIKSEAVKFLEKIDDKYDLIFTDPPYEATFYDKIVATTFERNLLNEDGLLIIEHDKRTKLEHLPNFQYSRKYGNVVFSFFNL